MCDVCIRQTAKVLWKLAKVEVLNIGCPLGENQLIFGTVTENKKELQGRKGVRYANLVRDAEKTERQDVSDCVAYDLNCFCLSVPLSTLINHQTSDGLGVFDFFIQKSINLPSMTISLTVDVDIIFK